MFPKIVIRRVLQTVVSIMILTFYLKGEIFLYNKMEIKQGVFKVYRNIFQIKGRSENLKKFQIMRIKEVKVEKEKTLSREVKDSISYEGILRRGGKILAMVNVNGEYFIVSVNDMILNKIKILNITKTKLTVLADSVRVEVLRKGESDD